MSDLLKNIQAYFSSLFGIVLILLAVASAYFNFPKEHSIVIDIVAGSFGFILIFTNPEKIAQELWEILKAKINGFKSKA